METPNTVEKRGGDAVVDPLDKVPLDTHTNTHIDRQTGRQTDRQIDRQAGRRTHTHTHTHTHAYDEVQPASRAVPHGRRTAAAYTHLPLDR